MMQGRPPLPLLLLGVSRAQHAVAASSGWAKLQFQTADGGFDVHGPCPAHIGAVSYPEADCAAAGTFVPVEGQEGQFRHAECRRSFWGLELRTCSGHLRDD